MADIYVSEVRAALSGRVSFDQFIELYFNAKRSSSGAYVNARGEILNLGIASEFYEEYIQSNWTLEKYIEKTTSQEVA